MARKIDLTKKLSKADVAWLTARYPLSYVERMKELAGTVTEEAENGPETPEDAEEADSANDAPPSPETGEEDLIGDTEKPFDPADHDVDGVNKYLKTASDEEKSRVLAAEAEGKGRSTILNA